MWETLKSLEFRQASRSSGVQLKRQRNLVISFFSHLHFSPPPQGLPSHCSCNCFRERERESLYDIAIPPSNTHSGGGRIVFSLAGNFREHLFHCLYPEGAFFLFSVNSFSFFLLPTPFYFSTAQTQAYRDFGSSYSTLLCSLLMNKSRIWCFLKA